MLPAVLFLMASLPAFGVQVQSTPLPAGASADEASSEAAMLVSEGAAEFQSGNFKTALKRFREADEVAGGQSWAAVAGAASTSIQLGKISLAQDYARRLLEFDQTASQMGLAHHLMGVCLARKNKPQEAEVALQEALALLPGRPLYIRAALAGVLCSLSREEEALGLLDDDGLCAQADNASSDGVGRQGPVRFEVGGDITEPIKLSGNNPRYTEAALRARVVGMVVVDVIIGADGNVKCLKVLDGLSHGLTCSAAQAVITWKFRPGELRGEPIELSYYLTVNFALR